MNRLLVFLLAGTLALAAPLRAQQNQHARPQGHSHRASGHADADDVRAVLRSLVVHQVRYHAQHGRYASTLRELGLPQPRVIAVRITASGAEGFAAISTSPTEECFFFSGRAAPPRPDLSRPDELVCRARRDP